MLLNILYRFILRYRFSFASNDSFILMFNIYSLYYKILEIYT